MSDRVVGKGPIKAYTQSEIIERFKDVHGDRYVYDRVKYKNTRVNLIG